MEDRNYSEQIAYEIDQEVRQIIENCYARARQILTENRDKMDRVAQALLERESLTREEFLALLQDEPAATEGAAAPTTAPAAEAKPVAEKSEPTETPQPAKRLKPRAAPG
jgi:cell division protease FtsH